MRRREHLLDEPEPHGRAGVRTRQRAGEQAALAHVSRQALRAPFTEPGEVVRGHGRRPLRRGVVLEHGLAESWGRERHRRPHRSTRRAFGGEVDQAMMGSTANLSADEPRHHEGLEPHQRSLVASSDLLIRACSRLSRARAPTSTRWARCRARSRTTPWPSQGRRGSARDSRWPAPRRRGPRWSRIAPGRPLRLRDTRGRRQREPDRARGGGSRARGAPGALV